MDKTEWVALTHKQLFYEYTISVEHARIGQGWAFCPPPAALNFPVEVQAFVHS